MGETETGGLILLVDHDAESRRHARHLLELYGVEVVQATNGIAALELVQRLPQSFRLVIAELELPGLSGAVLVDTLRLFRPDLPTICVSNRSAAVAANGRRCLVKPLQGSELQLALENGHAHGDDRPAVPESVIARARARYAQVGDLVEAAMELARAASP